MFNLNKSRFVFITLLMFICFPASGEENGFLVKIRNQLIDGKKTEIHLDRVIGESSPYFGVIQDFKLKKKRIGIDLKFIKNTNSIDYLESTYNLLASIEQTGQSILETKDKY